MERYIEKKRERRIRDFRRMVARAYDVFKLSFEVPSPGSRTIPPVDTWEDVFVARRRAARRWAEHLKHCSRGAHGCGNHRRYWGDRTLQEKRHALAAVEQLIEEGRLDDGPGVRKVGRRRPWV
ncbi:MAG: hypothetical protein IPJ24_04115 [bacterium]|nr:hypothetical protein [bacterium]